MSRHLPPFCKICLAFSIYGILSFMLNKRGWYCLYNLYIILILNCNPMFCFISLWFYGLFNICAFFGSTLLSDGWCMRYIWNMTGFQLLSLFGCFMVDDVFRLTLRFVGNYTPLWPLSSGCRYKHPVVDINIANTQLCDIRASTLICIMPL